MYRALTASSFAARQSKHVYNNLLHQKTNGVYTLSGVCCRLLLPIFLKIDASTAARGQQRLLEEFDFFDQQLLKQQQQQGRAAPTSATVSTEPQKLPYYLCGGSLSAADVSLACLGGYIVGAPYQQYVPAVKELPKELEMFIEVILSEYPGHR